MAYSTQTDTLAQMSSTRLKRQRDRLVEGKVDIQGDPIAKSGTGTLYTTTPDPFDNVMLHGTTHLM